MKIALQGFEPQPAPVASKAVPALPAAMATRQKARLRFVPAAAETRLFHAL